MKGYVNGFYVKPWGDEDKLERYSVKKFINDCEIAVMIMIFLAGCFQIGSWIWWFLTNIQI